MANNLDERVDKAIKQLEDVEDNYLINEIKRIADQIPAIEELIAHGIDVDNNTKKLLSLKQNQVKMKIRRQQIANTIAAERTFRKNRADLSTKIAEHNLSIEGIETYLTAIRILPTSEHKRYQEEIDKLLYNTGLVSDPANGKTNPVEIEKARNKKRNANIALLKENAHKLQIGQNALYGNVEPNEFSADRETLRKGQERRAKGVLLKGLEGKLTELDGKVLSDADKDRLRVLEKNKKELESLQKKIRDFENLKKDYEKLKAELSAATSEEDRRRIREEMKRKWNALKNLGAIDGNNLNAELAALQGKKATLNSEISGTTSALSDIVSLLDEIKGIFRKLNVKDKNGNPYQFDFDSARTMMNEYMSAQHLDSTRLKAEKKMMDDISRKWGVKLPRNRVDFDYVAALDARKVEIEKNQRAWHIQPGWEARTAIPTAPGTPAPTPASAPGVAPAAGTPASAPGRVAPVAPTPGTPASAPGRVAPAAPATGTPASTPGAAPTPGTSASAPGRVAPAAPASEPAPAPEPTPEAPVSLEELKRERKIENGSVVRINRNTGKLETQDLNDYLVDTNKQLEKEMKEISKMIKKLPRKKRNEFFKDFKGVSNKDLEPALKGRKGAIKSLVEDLEADPYGSLEMLIALRSATDLEEIKSCLKKESNPYNFGASDLKEVVKEETKKGLFGLFRKTTRLRVLSSDEIAGRREVSELAREMLGEGNGYTYGSRERSRGHGRDSMDISR